eukprot:TRINITY_DN539_c0_g1_i1.p1 TRINITY_DN539_c0_g1~~TRINITY_DN539_c0_g1_i1.p1  ORF type:complete len:106 (+),score=27.48 TRINITY_DN539_c0_g1_i1:66-383(+)
MAFSLRLDSVGSKSGHEILEEESKIAGGRSISVVFVLPTGKKTEAAVFQSGQTVEFLKAWVERHHEIPYSIQKLYLNGKMMADPLTLSDFPDLAGKNSTEIEVRQ